MAEIEAYPISDETAFSRRSNFKPGITNGEYYGGDRDVP